MPLPSFPWHAREESTTLTAQNIYFRNLVGEVGLAEGNRRTIRPDINVANEPSEFPSTRSASAATLAEPMRLRRPPHSERHLEIVSSTGRVITAIEFLSPWNKVGVRAREQYTRKQLKYLQAGVNLVEIDLVRQGGYVLLAPLDEIPDRVRDSYLICVYRDISPDEIDLYPAPITGPLPNIPIPLRLDEPNAVLQLQPLVDASYHDGRYYRLCYQTDPCPPFDPIQAKWVYQCLRIQGRRA